MHADVFGLHPDGTGEPRKLGVLGLHLRWNGLVVLEWPIMAGGGRGHPAGPCRVASLRVGPWREVADPGVTETALCVSCRHVVLCECVEGTGRLCQGPHLAQVPGILLRRTRAGSDSE